MWIMEVGPLISRIFAQDNLGLECKLKDIVLDDGT